MEIAVNDQEEDEPKLGVGMIRSKAFATENVWLGRVRTQAGERPRQNTRGWNFNQER